MPVKTACLLSLAALVSISSSLFINSASSYGLEAPYPHAQITSLFIGSTSSSSSVVDHPLHASDNYAQIEKKLTILDHKIASYRQQLRETRHSLAKARIMARKHHRTLRRDLTVINDQISRLNAELKYKKDQNATARSEQLKALQAQAIHAEQEVELAAVQLRQIDTQFKQVQITNRETLKGMLQQRDRLKQALSDMPSKANSNYSASTDRPTNNPKKRTHPQQQKKNQHKNNQDDKGQNKRKKSNKSKSGTTEQKIVQTVPTRSSRHMLISISDTSLKRLEPHLYLRPILNSLSIKHIALNQHAFLQEADYNHKKAEAAMIKEIVRQTKKHKIAKSGLMLLGHGEVGQAPLKVAEALWKQRRIKTSLLLLIDASMPEQQQRQESAPQTKQLVIEQSKKKPSSKNGLLALPNAVKSLVNLWYLSDKQDFKRSSNNVLTRSSKSILGYLDLARGVPAIQQPLYIDQAMRDKSTATKALDRPLDELAFLNQMSKELPMLLRGIKEGTSIRYTFANLTSSSPELSATSPPYPPSLPTFANEQATLTLRGRALFSRCYTEIVFKEDSAYVTFSIPNRDIYHEFFLYNPKAILFNTLGQPLFHDYPSENEYTTAYENGHFSLHMKENSLSLQLKLGQSLSPKCRFTL